MKVYLVYWCNNEEWEDYFESVDAVFSTREKAEQSILARGYKQHVPTSEWERRNKVGWFDSEFDWYGHCDSMWVREMEVDEWKDGL